MTYFIKRFRLDGETTIVETDLTLAQAQEHCEREDTHGNGWFDGFTSTDNDDPDDYRHESNHSREEW